MPATEAGVGTQACGYEAFFRTFWHRDWVAGAYIWKWFPGAGVATGNRGRGFTPQSKPALRVLSKWYGRE